MDLFTPIGKGQRGLIASSRSRKNNVCKISGERDCEKITPKFIRLYCSLMNDLKK